VQKDPVAVKARIGVVPDESNLYPELTCHRNLDYLGQPYRLGRSERRQRIDELLARFHLADRADKPFKSLSKGLKRRLTVAAALIHSPEVVFLDEPTTGLDVPSARDLRKLVKEINQAGATVFLTTHNLAEAEELAGRVAILLQGRLVTLGRTEEIRRRVGQTRFISVTFSRSVPAETIRAACQAVRSVAAEGDRFRLEAVETGPAVAQLADLARRENIDIVDLTTAPPSLEETFVSIINQEAGS
ncbi:MAG: ABC transporter ATP-binding protein, partial [Deltaproteobacteria bacterium]|nr:ABC transporter ATP-binding protein [Deltaproteobacteria bacterium]